MRYDKITHWPGWKLGNTWGILWEKGEGWPSHRMTQNAEPWDIALWCTQWIAVESQYLNVWIHVLYCVYIPPPLPLTLEYLAGGKARNLWDIFRAREISSPLRVFRASKRDGGGAPDARLIDQKANRAWPLRTPASGLWGYPETESYCCHGISGGRLLGL